MRRRSTVASLAAVAIAVSACGTGSDDAGPAAPPATAPVEQPPTGDADPVDPGAGDTAPDAAPANDAGVSVTEAPIDSTTGGEMDPAPTDDPATDDAATDAGDQGAPSTDEPAAEAVVEEPEPAPLGGRAFAPSVEPASDFDGNPLPDLVVNDVGRDQDANIRNVFPSDRPVLLWTWAPH